MAEKQKPTGDWQFDDVVFNVNGYDTKQNVEGGILNPSGYVQSNKKGAELWKEVARSAGIDPDRAAVKFKVNAAQQLIAGYPFAPGLDQAKGITAVRHFKTGVISVHLGGVFKAASSLKPAGKVRVFFSAEVDPEGKPFMLINLALAVAHVSRKRKKKGAAKEPPAAPEGEAAPGADI